MKSLVLVTALVAASPAMAQDKVQATVIDHYKVEVQSEPYTKNKCVMVDVPVYGTNQRQGNAAEGALLGMIIGGVLGKGVSGNDDGAAAGAVIGGLIGADKGAKPKSERVVTGYKKEQRCENVVHYRDVEKTVYSHSIVKFEVDGFLYEVPFYK